jgi:hypothetical protein
MDVNIIYEIYTAIISNLVNKFREYMGLGNDPDIENMYQKMEQLDKIIQLKDQYSPDKLISGLQSGEIDQSLLAQLLDYEIYTPEEMQNIINQANVNIDVNDLINKTETQENNISSGSPIAYFGDSKIVKNKIKG